MKQIKKLVGWVLILAPFFVVFAIMVTTIGWSDAVFVMVASLVITSVIGIGVYIIT